jgi:flagellum-specific ATP synthase
LAVRTLIDELDHIPEFQLYGRVTGVLGLMVEVAGLDRALSIGGRCQIVARGDKRIACEVIGFRQGRALLLPFGRLEGVGLGCKAELVRSNRVI